jgi:hypothetical protein
MAAMEVMVGASSAAADMEVMVDTANMAIMVGTADMAVAMAVDVQAITVTLEEARARVPPRVSPAVPEEEVSAALVH